MCSRGELFGIYCSSLFCCSLYCFFSSLGHVHLLRCQCISPSCVLFAEFVAVFATNCICLFALMDLISVSMFGLYLCLRCRCFYWRNASRGWRPPVLGFTQFYSDISTSLCSFWAFNGYELGFCKGFYEWNPEIFLRSIC